MSSIENLDILSYGQYIKSNTNNNGDILVSNGTEYVNVNNNPSGTNKYFVADSSTSSGVNWTNFVIIPTGTFTVSATNSGSAFSDLQSLTTVRVGGFLNWDTLGRKVTFVMPISANNVKTIIRGITTGTDTWIGNFSNVTGGNMDIQLCYFADNTQSDNSDIQLFPGATYQLDSTYWDTNLNRPIEFTINNVAISAGQSIFYRFTNNYTGSNFQINGGGGVVMTSIFY